MKGHRLILIDRGEGHIHRYTPKCSCGHWTGVHRPTKDRAAREWRLLHMLGQTKLRRRRIPISPRPLTPVDQLPELLRPRNF